VALSTGSGVALRNGLIVVLGAGFAVAVGVGCGFAVGVGVSAVVAGVLAWNGVDAASCARTKATAASQRNARTDERIMIICEKFLGRR
jgi:hypothetical protein